MVYDESKLSFLRTCLCFYSALAILEPQIYVVVEQFEAENISLLSGRLVSSVRTLTCNYSAKTKLYSLNIQEAEHSFCIS